MRDVQRLPGGTRLLGLCLLLGAALWFGFRLPASAAPPGQDGSGPTSPENEACLACHANASTTMLPSGEALYLGIDPQRYATSVHGSDGHACTSCHTDISGYPHPAITAATRRDFTLELTGVCQACHADKFELTHDSIHQKALDAGNKEAAVCIDCHNPHGQDRITDKATGRTLPAARLTIPQTCARCHSTVYDQYKESVHGAALVDYQNYDVPTCIDCHGVHQIPDPTTSHFRLDSPLICAKCHTDPARMDKYGISTQVVNTYIADFHGTTVTLFEKQAPDQISNKPVCIDCHGFHDIKSASDPQKGLQVRENLLGKCQACHPDATTSFSAAWLSHYIPSRDKYPVVYYIDLFYKIVIPTLIGGMLLFVVGDTGRRFANRRRAAKTNQDKGGSSA